MKQLSKRIVAICSCIMLIIMHIFVLGGSGIRDKKLVKAEEITKSLLISNDENYDGVCSGYYIKGLDEQEDFILVTSNNGGYAIFTTEFQLVEYSPYNKSPYGDIAKSNSYYAGPSSYFEKGENEEIKNIHTGEKIEKAARLELSSAVKSKLKESHEQEKLKTEELKKIEIEQRKEEKENIIKTIDECERENLLRNPEEQINGLAIDIILGEGDILNPDNEQAKDIAKFVEDYDFFIGNGYYAINEVGSCGTVATQLLMAYINGVKDSRLITKPKFLSRYGTDYVYDKELSYLEMTPNSLEYRNTTYKRGNTADYKDSNGYFINGGDNGVSSNWSDLFYYKKSYDNNLPYIKLVDSLLYVSKHSQTEIQQLQEQATTFSEYLLWLINPVPGAYPIDIENGVNKYIERYCPEISDEILCARQILPSNNTLKSQIEQGNPFIAGISNGLINAAESHLCVVYGYQTLIIEDVVELGYIAHMGHDRDYDYCWFNSSWVYNTLFLQSSHVHNYERTKHQTIFQCVGQNGCGHKKIVHYHFLENSAYQYIDENIHEERCSCGKSRRTRHTINFQGHIESLNANQHSYVCYCGAECKGEHSYTYLQLENEDKTIYHIKKCAICGYWKLDEHFFKYSTCYFCNAAQIFN